MRKIIAVASALILSGCVLPGQLKAGLDGLIGKPLSVAVDKLGLPTSENTVAGMHLVRWKVLSATELQCLVTLQIDENQIIIKQSAEGNLGGCEGYIRALRK